MYSRQRPRERSADGVRIQDGGLSWRLECSHLSGSKPSPVQDGQACGTAETHGGPYAVTLSRQKCEMECLGGETDSGKVAREKEAGCSWPRREADIEPR